MPLHTPHTLRTTPHKHHTNTTQLGAAEHNRPHTSHDCHTDGSRHHPGRLADRRAARAARAARLKAAPAAAPEPKPKQKKKRSKAPAPAPAPKPKKPKKKKASKADKDFAMDFDG